MSDTRTHTHTMRSCGCEKVWGLECEFQPCLSFSSLWIYDAINPGRYAEHTHFTLSRTFSVWVKHTKRGGDVMNWAWTCAGKKAQPGKRCVTLPIVYVWFDLNLDFYHFLIFWCIFGKAQTNHLCTSTHTLCSNPGYLSAGLLLSTRLFSSCQRSEHHGLRQISLTCCTPWASGSGGGGGGTGPKCTCQYICVFMFRRMHKCAYIGASPDVFMLRRPRVGVGGTELAPTWDLSQN